METKHMLRMMVLVAIPVLFFFFMPESARAAQKLSKTEIELEQGKSRTIKVKNPKKNVKWSVSGKNLVTVSASGKHNETAKIKAGKKTGKCTLIAKIGKTKLKCTVTVRKRSSKARKGTIDETKKYAPSEPSTGLDETSGFVNAMAEASVRLFREVQKRSGDHKNCLISPDSVITCMNLAAGGASGKTRSEMKKALGGIAPEKYGKYLLRLHSRLSGYKSSEYAVANSAWYRRNAITLNNAYLKKAARIYGAQIFSADFDAETVKDVNKWVKKNTRGKIKKIVDRFEASARILLMNATYFKASWSKPYSSTTAGTFTREDGTTKKIQALEGTEHEYFTLNQAECFVKSYNGGFNFVAMLPKKGTAVSEYIQGLDGREFLKAYKNRKRKGIIVKTMIPEFGYSFEMCLNEPLISMGMRRAFGQNADFSKMTEDPTAIDTVLHKTRIDLDKNGTEAAAVTAALVKATAYYEPDPVIKEIRLDRPFVYAIVDSETGIPLFIGSVACP